VPCSVTNEAMMMHDSLLLASEICSHALRVVIDFVRVRSRSYLSPTPRPRFMTGLGNKVFNSKDDIEGAAVFILVCSFWES
jgi:hypothetical protein